jgi:predicted fused transcriptional regulator/phosphomethylpyrimidine kinase
MNTKMVMNIRYEFDIAIDVEDYLREVLDVEPENATEQQREEAREVVISEIKESYAAQDFMQHVVNTKRPIENGTSNTWNEFTYNIDLIPTE